MTLVDKVNSDQQLATLRIDPTNEQVGAMSPVLTTPAAFAAGLAATGVGAGAVPGGPDIGRIID